MKYIATNELKMIRKKVLLALALLLTCNFALATPIFYSSPGSDPAGDQAWQAVFPSFIEEDFEQQGLWYGGTNEFTIGSITVTTNPRVVDYGIGQQCIGFGSGPGLPGSSIGTLCSRTVSPYNFTTNLTLTFSQTIYGFGTWITENFPYFPANVQNLAFSLSVNGITSNLLDSNAGIGGIEGWLGVSDENGFNQVSIITQISGEYFLDHMQVATAQPIQLTPPSTSVPSPATLALFVLGLVGLGYSRRKQK